MDSRNMSLRCTGILLGAALLVAACQKPASEKKEPPHLQWVVKSIEYAAACRQTYALAWPIVKESAKEETRNWTVVLDVDETVLNNVQYEVERAALDSVFSRASWTAWVRREEATPVPGVSEFIERVRTLGPQAHVAFITNRRFENEAATINNLRKLGLYQEGDAVLSKKGSDDTKLARRRCLEEGSGRCAEYGPLKIIALFGDNIRDFIEMNGSEDAQAYLGNGLANDENWGSKYFILPNPLYGSWQNDYQ